MISLSSCCERVYTYAYAVDKFSTTSSDVMMTYFVGGAARTP